MSKKIKNVYFYGNGKAEAKGEALTKSVLGGKGVGLMEMTSIGLPVPAGFTVSIQACEAYYKGGRKLPKGLDKEVKEALAKLEKCTGKKLGDPKNPLLVSVRSGAARSMPGMLETILNLGLNDKSVEGMGKLMNNPRFAYDSYRRFIQMYSTTAMGLSKEPMEHMLHEMKNQLGIKNDPEIPAEKLKELCERFKAFYKEKKGEDFPQDPMVQLWGAIKAVFGSWEAEKSVTYRKVEKITDLKGTAVNIVQMVFGNKNDRSGTGVCFTRDPNSGVNEFYGDLLINAQGEDVVAGIRTPLRLIELKKVMPKAYKQLCGVRQTLEKYYKEMQDLEFTIEDEKLYMLQCRTGKRSPRATFRIAADMVKENLISKGEAILRITPEDIERLFYPVISEKTPKGDLAQRRIATGINAVPGAATGQIVFTAEAAEGWHKDGKSVILVRRETSPEDVGGMHASSGILTATGGKTSHAAVVARGWGKCCIVGCEALQIDEHNRKLVVNGREFYEGAQLTLDGNTGEVYDGELPLDRPEPPQEYYTIMKWADAFRAINVRTNADTPYDAKKARDFGAEGIGLCRTEHMFFDTEERRLAIQQMIVADTTEARKEALGRLLPFQRADFEGIFEAMDGLPVTVRLIDPPLHEFVPHDREGQEAVARQCGVPVEKVAHRVESLKEANPMLGHRGCRLCISYPEILEMQIRAIIEAACNCAAKKIKVLPEIMHPLVLDKKELRILVDRTHAVAKQVFEEKKIKVNYMVGTMIEVPRAALLADEIAEVAEFFSFGTNDLTQFTMALSRDDAGKFLPDYVDDKKAGVFSDDPFQSLDQNGVGKLVKLGIELGRKTNKKIKIGICGEHGGEGKSVKFCAKVGMNYVSCSPYRVPIARLAAGQVEAEKKLSKKGKRK